MNDLDLLQAALRRVADRGDITIQNAHAFQVLANEIKRLEEERSAFDALRDPSS